MILVGFDDPKNLGKNERILCFVVAFIGRNSSVGIKYVSERRIEKSYLSYCGYEASSNNVYLDIKYLNQGRCLTLSMFQRKVSSSHQKSLVLLESLSSFQIISSIDGLSPILKVFSISISVHDLLFTICREKF